jgi:hypothetical protein
MSIRSRRQGILPYRIEATEGAEGLTSHAGLALAAETLRALVPEAFVNEQLGMRQRDGGLTDSKKLESVVLLMAAGGENYEDINVLRADQGLQRLLGYTLPSADWVRAFAKGFHDEALLEQAKARRPAGLVSYIPDESEPLQGLGRVNTALCHAVARRGKGRRATLDHDATIQECHKSQALPHYKGGRG